MKISIYGVGYVGLVSGVCFASTGHQVMCYDIEAEKISMLQQGQTVLYEPDFFDLLAGTLEKKAIEFTTDLEKTIAFSDMHLICVGTPSEDNNGKANLTYLIQAIENIALHARDHFIMIIKSTVPVGTAQKAKKRIEELFAEQNKDTAFHVVSCPEFLAQGSAVKNFLHPDRVVVGTDSSYAFDRVKELYAPVTQEAHVPVIQMRNSSAELTKYASNLFLATKISYMNEISRIAELIGADIAETIQGMVADKRIGSAMSNPGCGFGGSCLPKDLKALIYQSEMYNHNPILLKAVLEVNVEQRRFFISKVFSLCEFNVKDKIFAIWGLSFKPNTDDLREAVSCDLISALAKAGGQIHAYDPAAGPNAKIKFQSFSNFTLCETKEQSLKDADFLIVMAEWSEFYNLDYNLLKSSMRYPVLIDCRNMYDPKMITQHGVAYFSIGRGFLPGAAC